jgi:hypothetical protein
MSTSAFFHLEGEDSGAYYPYLWMCPGCIAHGKTPQDSYLPDSILKGSRRYANPDLLSRPNGRMIGDFGALALRVIIEHVIGSEARYTSGGGHRGEFDIVITTESQLLLGEIKASPLVAFPVGVEQESGNGMHHTWSMESIRGTTWFMYVGAARNGRRKVPLAVPSGRMWPLPDILSMAQNPEIVEELLQAWHRHLLGYRLFNSEDPQTRWLRFGCGNIETRNTETGQRIQLRVDNTKSLPGIDRTDDIKKGIAQVMLFGRLKKGCQVKAIKTVLFGNLYAETHHEHYVKPLASLELMWPNEQPVFLFDAIVALSRNIVNDVNLQDLISLPNEPYDDDWIDPATLAGDLAAGDGDE